MKSQKIIRVASLTAKLFVFSALALTATVSLAETKPVSAKTDAAPQFAIYYPGAYTPRETPLLEKWFADAAAIKNREPVDPKALAGGVLPKDTPGLALVFDITEDWVRYNNRKYAPDDRLLNDAVYARSLGYRDVVAYPTIGAAQDFVSYPMAAVDKLLADDINGSITFYKPVYPGDRLHVFDTARSLTDITPDKGSIYRSMVNEHGTSIYNQRGEKVYDQMYRVQQNIESYKNNDGPKSPTFAELWIGPNWQSRPAHYYTDADWTLIKKIWADEKPRGDAPLYWEDVKVGAQPNPTLDGPILASVLPAEDWAMGAGGSKTLKNEIMDPAIFKTMIRGKSDGIYRMPSRDDNVPPAPATVAHADNSNLAKLGFNEADIHNGTIQRSPLMNFMGRDFAIRHILNWMGDRGWLYNIRWAIMDPRALVKVGYTLPVNTRAWHDFLDQVPFMKGKHVNAHGLVGDVALVNSYVTRKYIENGKFMVDLVWWVQTIDRKAIWQEGSATVILPSRNGADVQKGGGANLTEDRVL